MRADNLKISNILLSLLFLIPLNSFGRCEIRIGHPTGKYKTVDENPAGTELTCSGTGDNECVWSSDQYVIYVNNVPITDNMAAQLVQQNVNNNVNSGQVSGDNNVGYYSWYFTANNELIFKFEDGI